MWEPIAVLALLAGLFWDRSRANRRQIQAWYAALAPYGSRIEGTPTAEVRILTRQDSLHIRVTGIEDQEEDLVAVVFPEPWAFSGVEILATLFRPFGGRETTIGDRPFEVTFRLLGPSRLVSSLLDAETRRLMTSLKSWMEITGGELRMRMLTERASLLLPTFLEIARRLSQPLDVAQRLAENAQKDPVAGVRLHNLVLLLGELPGDPKTVAVLRAACSDPSPQVRLRAARELGAEGGGVLAELAASAEDDAVSAEAVSLLGRDLPLQHTREILAQALHRRRILTACACLEALGLGGDAADVQVLANVMAGETVELAVAAATALGHLGTAAAVLLLKEAAESRPRDYDFRKAIRQAIAEIKSRLPGASPGQLSLASTEAGSLSLAPAEAGQLSLAGDPAGQLSLGGGEEEV
jgi:hypothetical protein